MSAVADDLQLLGLTEFLVRPQFSWHIRDLLPAESIMVTFGAPKSGKTFAICDLAMHAAHGMPWHGCEIKKALRVAFMAGEGTNGLRLRLQAWLSHHQPTNEGQFKVLPKSLSLPMRTAEVCALMLSYKPDIIVIDTLNAYFGAGDESSTKDMTQFVASIRTLRDSVTCSIIIIHHTGLADASRERGSSVLRGAVDVITQCAKDGAGSGLVGFQVIAARDLESWQQPIGLRLQPVESIWADDDGNPLTTCIVEASDQPVTLPGRDSPTTAAQDKVVQAVRDIIATKGVAKGTAVLIAKADVRKRAIELGASYSSIYRNIINLAPRMGWRLLEPGGLEVRQQ